MLNYVVSLSDKEELSNFQDKHFLGNEFPKKVLIQSLCKDFRYQKVQDF